MKPIFVPTNFSDEMSGAIEIASLHARETSTRVLLHHNVATTLAWSDYSTTEKNNYPDVLATTHAAEIKLEKLAGELQRQDIQSGWVVTHGVTSAEIVIRSRIAEAGMIIMGSHGVDEPERAFIGSTIQSVMRSAQVPVMNVKAKTSYSKLGRVVLPLDFNTNIHSAFTDIFGLIPRRDPEVHLLFVNTPSKFRTTTDIKYEMTKFATQYPGIRFIFGIYEHTDVVKGIIEYSESVSADMIAMVAHDKLHKAKYLIGKTERVVFYSQIPVVSLNERVYWPALT